jgi:hypothetical protein
MSDYVIIEGADELFRDLTGLSDEAIDAGVEAVSDYIIEIMKIYPPYKSVSRASVYGSTFKTERQRKYFFWALNNGALKVGNHRTQTLRDNWKKELKGKDTLVVNETDYIGFVMMDEYQSKLLGEVGWETVSKRIARGSYKMDDVFDGAVNTVMRKRGL